MSRRSNRLTAWLGILAILLAVFAPLGSQLAERAAQTSLSAEALCSAAGHDAALAPGNGHADAFASRLAAHLDACGYCGLLAHLPALGSTPPAVAAGPFGPDLHAPQPLPDRVRRVRYLRHPSRAPPLDA
ncbi:DUF2946 domain-containing protein [Paraburkholderia lycopersici]|uniref:DUF2946 domain-containing protein n=1 Tax=Paraburkholderia lycopersici TaxID=416944 RepID=A0A1G6GMC7_9BURK|nr:DUF2946 domain-containing protein [Paraburkholderia lycopersici]SDB82983.1 Protein of unknown function [Paraburkholderia lycopersici]